MLEENRLIRNDSDQRLDEGLNESFNEAHLHDGQIIGEVHKLLRLNSSYEDIKTKALDKTTKLLFKTDFNNPRTLTRLLKLGILPETN